MPRRPILLLAVAALAAAPAVPAAAAVRPAAGVSEGPTSQRLGAAVTVSRDGTIARRFNLSWTARCASSDATTITQQTRITNGRFTGARYADAGDYRQSARRHGRRVTLAIRWTVKLRFVSARRARGLWTAVVVVSDTARGTRLDTCRTPQVGFALAHR